MHCMYDFNAILITHILCIIFRVSPHQIKNQKIPLKSTTCHLFDVNNMSRLDLNVHSAHCERLTGIYLCCVMQPPPDQTMWT